MDINKGQTVKCATCGVEAEGYVDFNILTGPDGWQTIYSNRRWTHECPACWGVYLTKVTNAAAA